MIYHWLLSMLKRYNNSFTNWQISKKQILHLVWTMMIFILFILCSNFLIYSNVAIKNHQYQSNLLQDSVEGDIADLYGGDDDYSNDIGNMNYLFWEKNISVWNHFKIEIQLIKISLFAQSKKRIHRSGIDNSDILEI